MDDIEGVGIAAVTAFGWSEDGQHIWAMHRLRDGTEYRLVYPYAAAGRLITMFIHAARSASAQRAARDPSEAAAGLDSNLLAVEEVRMATSPEGARAILHLTTTDRVPIAMEMPLEVLNEVAEQSKQLLARLGTDAPPRGPLH
jgi:hypothetical protein